MRAAFAAHGGREQGTEGDSFFVVFDSALEAVRAAVDAPARARRRAVAAGRRGQRPDGPPRRRGVGLGRRARRARHQSRRADRGGGARRPGRGLRRGPLARGRGPRRASISLRGLGSHRLKDLREPQPLCQVVADGLRMEFPPLRSLDAAAEQPADAADVVRRARAGAGRGRARCWSEPPRHADRPGRHGQDAALAPGRGERRRALPGRRVLRRPRDRPRADASSRRGSRPRSGSPRPAPDPRT